MGFIGKTILERLDKENYALRSYLSFENNKMKVTALSGLITDGASIPRYLWTIIGCPMNGKYVGSSIIHDGLYRSEIIKRKEADDLFLEMLEDNGVGYIKRHLMYIAVRAMGYFSWKSHTSESVIKNKKLMRVEYKNV